MADSQSPNEDTQGEHPSVGGDAPVLRGDVSPRTQRERRVGRVEDVTLPHFIIGEEDSTEDPSEDANTSSAWSHPTSDPITIPGGAAWDEAHHFYTPPRAYIGPRHLSTSAVSTLAARQNVDIRHRNPALQPRYRTQSEAAAEDDHPETSTQRRDRSLSAPSILTPAQRKCAEDLRRISDDFDREYRGSLEPNGIRTNVRPSSFPDVQQRSAAVWWRRIVQTFAPIPPPPRPSRPQPPSPISESEPHLEGSDVDDPHLEDL